MDTVNNIFERFVVAVRVSALVFLMSGAALAVLVGFCLIALVAFLPWWPLLFGIYYMVNGEYDWAIYALLLQIFILAIK